MTPRPRLQALVDALAGEHPRAIGIDIDFSPDEHGYITPDDPGFFQFCVDKAQKGTPIFLGVKRAEAEAPDAWLGSSYYRSLAADIGIRRDDPRMLPRWFQPDGAPVSCLTLSAALAGTAETQAAGVPRWLQPLMHLSPTIRPAEHFQDQEYLVDYGALDTLREGRLLAISPAAIHDQAERIGRKILLLGDATEGVSTDTFTLSNRTEPIPGVFLHACGVNTLVDAPLYALTPLGHVLIDALLSLSVFGTIALLRIGLRRQGRTADTERLEGWLTVGVVVLGLLVGVGLVHWVRVMWDDFLFVTLALILHPSAHRWLHTQEKALLHHEKTSQENP